MGQCFPFQKRPVQGRVLGEVRVQGGVQEGLSAIDKKLISELKIRTAPSLNLSNSSIHQRRKMQAGDTEKESKECRELRNSTKIQGVRVGFRSS